MKCILVKSNRSNSLFARCVSFCVLQLGLRCAKELQLQGWGTVEIALPCFSCDSCMYWIGRKTSKIGKNIFMDRYEQVGVEYFVYLFLTKDSPDS
mmetsp:Transcript_7929/g.23397  ORF Transcript_7929/g.23397 Transcript_7929/m.23397 type:complete len:95 (+) Transcript_7929:2815-3099(+)